MSALWNTPAWRNSLRKPIPIHESHLIEVVRQDARRQQARNTAADDDRVITFLELAIGGHRNLAR